jgi:ABC-2 type transport system ATP-binding protein
MSDPVIRLHDVVRDFGAVRALDHLSFEVAPGTVFGFLGPNGAGKTTAIRLMLGLLRPTEGRVEVFGLDPTHHGEAVRARSGALLEHNGLYERLSAQQNLEFFARTWRMRPAEYRPRIQELLERFGLWDRRRDVVGSWSRGMKQKLAVARAMLPRPALVFLDEPTAGLDPVASASLRDDLARLAADGNTTVFLTTHNLGEAERLCGVVGVIRRGKLVAFGPPSALRASRRAAVVRLVGRGFSPAIVEALARHDGLRNPRGDNGELRFELEGSTAPVIAWLVAQGVELEEVRREHATFEEAFLDLVDPEGRSAEEGPA